MKQNKLRNRINSIKIFIHVVFIIIKHKIRPEKQVLMSKDYAMALYSDINMALDREDEIYNQIDDLNKELSDIKTIMPEIR